MIDGIPMISAVVFTHCMFDIRSPEWHSWQVVQKSILNAHPISNIILNILNKANDLYKSKGYNWTKCNHDNGKSKMSVIANLLRPRFEILASPSCRRKSLDEDLAKCTEEQYGYLDELAGNDRIIISGLAGTGKTTLALETVRRSKEENPNTVVGFFCFNSLLGRKLENQCSRFQQSLKVGSFHSWMARFVGLLQVPHVIQGSDPWNNGLATKVLETLTGPGFKGGLLDLLVLDEAQDLFVGPCLDICDLLLKGGLKNGKWSFFGDFERQDIYTGGALSRNEFFESRIGGRCAQYRLSINCRNTQEISSTLTTLAKLKPGYSKVLRMDTRHSPEIHSYQSREEQITKVIDALNRILGEGFKPSDIVLLSNCRKGSLASSLSEAGPFKGRIREYSLDCQAISYTTTFAFKGLEAPVVIFTDIDKLEKSEEYDLFYTGMSRALHRLVIMVQKSVWEKLKETVL